MHKSKGMLKMDLAIRWECGDRCFPGTPNRYKVGVNRDSKCGVPTLPCDFAMPTSLILKMDLMNVQTGLLSCVVLVIS
jgi:hypothetical protein